MPNFKTVFMQQTTSQNAQGSMFRHLLCQSIKKKLSSLNLKKKYINLKLIAQQLVFSWERKWGSCSTEYLSILNKVIQDQQRKGRDISVPEGHTICS